MAPGSEWLFLKLNKMYTAVEKTGLFAFGKEIQHSNSASKTTEKSLGLFMVED